MIFLCQVDIVDPYLEDFLAHNFEDVCLCPYCTHVRFILRHMENTKRKATAGTCYQLAVCSDDYWGASKPRGRCSLIGGIYLGLPRKVLIICYYLLELSRKSLGNKFFYLLLLRPCKVRAFTIRQGLFPQEMRAPLLTALSRAMSRTEQSIGQTNKTKQNPYKQSPKYTS